MNDKSVVKKSILDDISEKTWKILWGLVCAMGIIFSAEHCLAAEPSRYCREFPAKICAANALGEGSLFYGIASQPLSAKNAGLFNGFTRLAGMFTGRVSALSIGQWRVGFAIDIR